MKEYWEKYIQPLCLAVAAFFGIFSTYQSMEAKKGADAAAAASNSTRLALDQAASSREDLKVDRDYQIQITQLVLTSLKEGNTKTQLAMVGLVGTIRDADLAQKLTLALTTSEDATVRKQAGNNLDANRSFDLQQKVDAPARAADAAPVRKVGVAAPAVGSTVLLTPNPDPRGWDMDIFWCEGEARKARADRLGQALAQMSDAREKLGGQALGRVRVRPLPALVNQRSQYQIFSDIAGPDLGDIAENALARNVSQIGAGLGVPLDIRPGSKKSAWYMSIFYCA